MNLNGYKTYALGILAILYAITQWLAGNTDGTAMLQIVEVALVGMGLRHGLAVAVKSG